MKTVSKTSTSTSKSKSKSTHKKTKSALPSSKLQDRTLVIVESPSKAHTIEKYLGSGYKVVASMGHLIDLPKSKLGIDTEHNFEPHYITVRGRAAILKQLQTLAKASSTILLAADNDREGEAIAWHLNNALMDKTTAQIKRITFNEITPNAIKEAIKAPRTLDIPKVDAQKARRFLDRLVGYNLSPILWKKVKGGLSAGRVQSVALRLICEREEEVNAFIPEEYWTLSASFSKDRKSFSADLILYQGTKPSLHTATEAKAIKEKLQGLSATVLSIQESSKSTHAYPPFTTSKLQQAAANRLAFTSKRTMKVAQELYEGINIGSGRTGLITYIRTDSVRVSKTALDSVRDFIKLNYPTSLPSTPNFYSTSKEAQDAHEAIRPTNLNSTPESIKSYLTPDQYKLYSIIYERFVSSQMSPCVYSQKTIEVQAGEAIFRTTISSVKDKGFTAALKLLASKDDKPQKTLPALKPSDTVSLVSVTETQHFTQGPSRYTDASIVKALEDKGIGRPSTYAPIISVLLERFYINRTNRQLVPTTLGKIVNKVLVTNFPSIINEKWTREIEERLDQIETGNLDYHTLLSDFYSPFKEHVDEVMQTAESLKGSFDEKTEETCEKCGSPMVKKLGRYGFFLACSSFPKCLNAKSIPLAPCPVKGCNGSIIERSSKKKGRKFYACSNYPTCTFRTYFKPLTATCPNCGWFLVEKYSKKQGSHKACINPACTYLHSEDTN